MIEEVPAGAVLDLDDPQIGIERSWRARCASTSADGAGSVFKLGLKARSAGRASSKADCGAGP